MLDFSENTYREILDLAIRHNFIAHCREYPFFRLNSRPISQQAVQQRLRANFKNPNFTCGLYIHFPFCISRCSFCKYYSEIIKDNSIINRYLEALKAELGQYNVPFDNIIFKNIYLGGGTPTILNEKQIYRLHDIFGQFFRVNQTTQISIEGTPESIKEDSLRAYRNFGVNRISIGVQSFNDDILKKVKRRHSCKDVFNAFEIVKKVGINYTGIDLIIGLPGESIASYRRTMRETIKLNPDFIECFLLTPGGWAKINRCPPLDHADLNYIIKLFKEEFGGNGYRIYFSGNFLGFVKKRVKGSKVMNQNTEGAYNQRVSCLALGPSAFSQFPFLKYKVLPDLDNYLRYCLIEKRLPDFYGFFLNDDDVRRQYIISRIGYYRYINKEAYHQLFDTHLIEDFPKEINYLIAKKIISENKQSFVWYFDEHEMGHEEFFLHALKYWYHPRYINQLIKKLPLQKLT